MPPRQLFFTCVLTIISLTSAEYSFTLYKSSIPAGTTNLDQLDPALPTYIIVHGWHQDSTNPGLLQMKNAYLSLAPANVVIFNWAPDSLTINYFGAAAAVLPAGKVLGHKIATLSSTLKINIKITKLIGFSLGAHVAGVAGKIFKYVTKTQLEHIVGLEAPIVGFVINTNRLNIHDAKFVLAFHTSIFGKIENYGHVDVYFNYNLLGWGLFQPNCPANPGLNVPAVFNNGWCNHVRSVAYWIESITNNHFWAVRCNCWFKQWNLCKDSGVLIGHGMNSTLRGAFCLKTTGVNPFGKGYAGIC
ncbi:hypothetical protein RN001_010418 [Aquatica leii]|uniref:Lipase domain-containing protein n=1 Tax=Aquatica leii TaxID=1421715 RepID=A0AAN7PWD2_9COLE|nr:hypothetical protein RN001_010418 [Aquatica leii]